MKNKHGANIFEISRDYGLALKDIADFSSNINPMGASPKAKLKVKDNIDLVSAYPDTDYIDLKNAISNYSGARKEDILLFTGTTEGLIEYIRLINPKNSLVFAPSYSEYEHELKKIKSTIHYYYLKEEEGFRVDVNRLIKQIKDNKIDLLVFSNPSNPTGTALEKNDIEKILKQTDTHLLVDETYVEFTDTKKFSSVELTKTYPNLFTLRGTSKFFAMPGIRLGYGIISSEPIKSSIETNEMLWNINIFADLMGQASFADRDFIKSVEDFVSAERSFIKKELDKIDEIKSYDFYGNFILSKILNESTAKELRNSLLPYGLVIRDCSNFKGLGEKYFRFCILDKKSNRRLIEKIAEYFA
ncbi:pyridoxal phosphate-dependent aminotransferase [Peptoniphilus catoniae]|uniref:pyridoxal phosphate-dependent aminotransferase n=1 Tax=Peptoniphilus catoniae TaxID=1660341 RepID=UPI0010FDD1DB|nr:histidinol-phosphate transaminase [Peptoniphilus catoniae]